MRVKSLCSITTALHSGVNNLTFGGKAGVSGAFALAAERLSLMRA